MSGNATKVMLVDDEKRLADMYAKWLEADYDVAVAYNGDEALEEITEDVDVVFLDRRMPGMSGDEVLDQIRERGIDCKVAMVTAVDPDFDIIEMGFDDYVVKPVTRDDLYEKVNQLLSRNEYQGKLQKYFALSSKKAALESEKTEEELEESEEFAQLQDDLEQLREETDDMLEDISDDGDFESLYRDLGA